MGVSAIRRRFSTSAAVSAAVFNCVRFARLVRPLGAAAMDHRARAAKFSVRFSSILDRSRSLGIVPRRDEASRGEAEGRVSWVEPWLRAALNSFRSKSMQDGSSWGEVPRSASSGNRSSASHRRDVSVLITGETGTGKELVARALHARAPRARAAVRRRQLRRASRGRCSRASSSATSAARSPAPTRTRTGVFELADGGTLFLDEIGELPLDAAGEAPARAPGARGRARSAAASACAVDVRVIAATNRDLAARGRAGAFREDLYYRLNVVTICACRRCASGARTSRCSREHFLDAATPRGSRRADVCRATRGARSSLDARLARQRARAARTSSRPRSSDCDGDSIEPEHLRFEGGAVPRGLPTEEPRRDVPRGAAARDAGVRAPHLLGQLRRFRGRITDVARHAGVTTKHVRELMRPARHRPPRLPPAAAALGGAPLVATVG